MDTAETFEEHSAGLVETRYYTFDRLPLRSGKTLDTVTLAYETYGTLNAKKNNAVLIVHALSGSAHAAGYHTREDKHPGWWDIYIGPGKPFDTEKYFIICSNIIGGCSGSTGPSSINPATDKHYGLDFPMITVQDMVNAQWHLVKHLGIEKLLSIAGGSLGGMQTLKWAIVYPGMVNSVITIASAASLSAQGIALNEVGRQAIMNDPNWNDGDYYDAKGPDAGLSLARMIGHITYLSEKHMHEKFGRRFKDEDLSVASFKHVFMVESYLHHQGNKFVDRFDANSYLYITKAIDYFDLHKDYGTLHSAFARVLANFLVISFTSDWLYPSSQSKEIVQALRVNGKNVMYTDIETDMGHDTFLLDYEPLKRTISNFLRREFERVSGEHHDI
jgi:homoserine O-acetyltransferase/O-succinyltransferase